MKALDACLEPVFESAPLSSLRKNKNAESHLAEDDGIHGNFAFVCKKLFDQAQVASIKYFTTHQ